MNKYSNLEFLPIYPIFEIVGLKLSDWNWFWNIIFGEKLSSSDKHYDS